MVLSRLGFGYWGNVLPAGLNSVTAGIGWFAVNSVSGAPPPELLTPLHPAVLLPPLRVGAPRVGVWGRNRAGAPCRLNLLPPIPLVLPLLIGGGGAGGGGFSREGAADAV